eukprot:3362009-Amphidinium_carterae.1
MFKCVRWSETRSIRLNERLCRSRQDRGPNGVSSLACALTVLPAAVCRMAVQQRQKSQMLPSTARGGALVNTSSGLQLRRRGGGGGGGGGTSRTLTSTRNCSVLVFLCRAEVSQALLLHEQYSSMQNCSNESDLIKTYTGCKPELGTACST